MAIDNYPKPRLPISNAMWRYNAVGGETTLSGYDSFGQPLQYTVNSEQLFLNGVMLVRGVDYAATTGTTITSLLALSAGDFVEILTYSNFNISTLPAPNITGKVLNNQLDKPSILLGNSTVNLGDTVSSLSGLTIDGNYNIMHTARGATNPTTNLLAGDLFWNTSASALQMYDGTSWISFAAPSSPDSVSSTDIGTSRAYANAAASVAFTPTNSGGVATTYYVTSTPGSLTSFGITSPITITGLTSSTQYSFTVTAQGTFGNSAPSSSTAPLTVTTVPQAPTIGTATATTGSGSMSVTFTAGATGGKTITGYTVTSTSGRSNTGVSSPIVVTEVANGTYQYSVTATNANGTSLASATTSGTVLLPSVSGGVLSSDATYYYRTFTANGNVVVANGSVPVDFLLIGGGASGAGGEGGTGGGGGGAGGLINFNSQTLAPNTYAAVIGGGAAGAFAASSNGTSSTFFTKTALGGGSAGNGTVAGVAGGSGGGTGRDSNKAGGASTQNSTYGYGFGNAGGAGQATTYAGGGGGGGAGTAGGIGSPTGPAGAGGNPGDFYAGNGGDGLNTFIIWLTAINAQMSGVLGWSTATSTGYIAAGGGGGAFQMDPTQLATKGKGGAGGGGNGGNGYDGRAGYAGVTNYRATGDGVANTGSGGGGVIGGTGAAYGDTRGAGAGGSGILVVRYLKTLVG
jgi:hypothetical protein